MTEYTYDYRNRLTSVVERNVVGVVINDVQFVYDVFDRRIAKTVDVDGVGSQPAETTRFVYDGLHVWADFDQAGQVTARYLYGDGIDQILARYQPGVGTAWYLADHLGTVRDIVDATGVVIDHVDYDSFGQIITETNPAQGDRFKFTGREWDVETSLYYYRARYFDPRQGRFVSADPLGFAAGDVNLYRYVNNAPVILRDPLGLEPIGYSVILQRDMAVGGAAVGAVMGYVCSYLEEWCQSGDATRATASGNLGMLQGAALGASLGYAAGSASALSKLVATSAGGAFVGLYLGTIPADLSVAGIRVGCLVAGILFGAAQRPGGLRNLGRGIWEFLGDQRGSVPIGEIGESGGCCGPGGNPSRPSFRQSELDVGQDLVGWDAQRSFINGRPARYGAQDSVRPDYSHPSQAMHVDVKNYDLSSPGNRGNLYRGIAQQAITRSQNLPSGAWQGVILDIRGQSIDPMVLQRIPTNIETATGGIIRAQNVIFKRS